MIRINPPLLQILSRTSFLRIITFRSNKLYSKRLSSLKQVDQQKTGDDIESWVRNNLRESTSSQHFHKDQVEFLNDAKASWKRNDEEKKVVSFVSKDTYLRHWHTKFQEGDTYTIATVIFMAKNEQKIFPLSQLMTLMNSIKSRRRNDHIHQIYVAYRNFIPALNKLDHKQGLEHQFLEIVITAEASLKNYQLCEVLFSNYIRYSNVKPEILSIGLRSFLAEGNLQLAIEFYIQALKNPDTFIMTNKELFKFLRDLSNHRDFSSMRYVFNLWLTYKCKEGVSSGKHIPGFRSLSLLHRTYKLLNDGSVLQNFLANDIVVKTGYADSIQFQLTEFCQELRSFGRSLTNEEIQEKISNLLERLNVETNDRREFYLSLLNIFVTRKDTANIAYVMSKIRDDKVIPLSGTFHLVIAQYFVNRGLLEHLIGYYSGVVRQQSSGRVRLQVAHIRQLWDCALRCYPMLTKEITNELKLLINRQDYVRNFPQLQLLSKETRKVTSKKMMGGSETYKSQLPEIDFERLKTLQSQISAHDISGATSTILESIRQGFCPQFNFYYLALKLCLDAQLPSLAKTLDDSCSKYYQKIPLKVNILWLRYEIISRYKDSLSKGPQSSLSKMQPIRDQLQEFEKTHRLSMNFQNYLQLAQLCIYIRDYEQGQRLIDDSYNLLNSQDKQQWTMYYMTALKIAVRSYNVGEFHRFLKDWNENPNARCITHGSLRQIKVFAKLFEKRKDRLTIADNANLKDIQNQITILVDKYVNIKFDGLNAMKGLTFFIKRWIEREIKELSKHSIKN